MSLVYLKIAEYLLSFNKIWNAHEKYIKLWRVTYTHPKALALHGGVQPAMG